MLYTLRGIILITLFASLGILGYKQEQLNTPAVPNVQASPLPQFSVFACDDAKVWVAEVQKAIVAAEADKAEDIRILDTLLGRAILDKNHACNKLAEDVLV